jgi:NAD(P)-dependent dehydrogenase (short-subunit alcohol dehydrogenase family)
MLLPTKSSLIYLRRLRWKDFEINTRGTYLVTRMFLQTLGAEKHGSIINISSGASISVIPGASSYGISKLAVNRMTEYIAVENPNVTCVSLDPGSVQTEALPGK